MEVRLPHYVIFNHILPRVPTKSVCRFNCVSKEWHFFLTSDMFKNKHNRLHIDNNHENNNKQTSFEFITIDCEAPPSDKVSTIHDIYIIASIHGLVCLGIIQDMRGDVVGYSDLILWNPLTDEYKSLSATNYHIIARNCKNPKFGLYYSCCEDDYRVLCLNLYGNNVYIYSLKSDSWREVDASQSTHILYHHAWSQCTYLNENLYFLQNKSNGRLSSIIRFDTKTELLSKIETPNVEDNPVAYDYFTTIMAKSGCIHVCEKSELVDKITCSLKTCIKLWKLDEYGNMKEVVTYQLSPYDSDNYAICGVFPFHLTNNGNWLMMKEYWYAEKYDIYEVNLNKKKDNKGKSGKDDDKGNMYDDYEMYGSVRAWVGHVRLAIDHVGYTETFVSPNQHMKQQHTT